MKLTARDKVFLEALTKYKNEYLSTYGYTNRASIHWFVKVLLLIVLVGSCYWGFYQVQNGFAYWGLLSLYAIFSASLVLNVIHDSSHQAIFKSKQKNNLLRNFGFFLLGNSPHLWWQEHVMDHHPVANVIGEDLGIIETPLLRFHVHQKYHNYHRYQHYYAPILYCLHMTEFYFYSEYGRVFRLSKKLKQKKIVYWFLLSKLFHFLFLFVFPLLWSVLSGWFVLLGFLYIQMIHS